MFVVLPGWLRLARERPRLPRFEGAGKNRRFLTEGVCMRRKFPKNVGFYRILPQSALRASSPLKTRGPRDFLKTIGTTNCNLNLCPPCRAEMLDDCRRGSHELSAATRRQTEIYISVTVIFAKVFLKKSVDFAQLYLTSALCLG